MSEQNQAENKEKVSRDTAPEKGGKRKKGCLAGCLIIIAVFAVILAGVSIFGYLNRHRLLPAAMSLFNVKASTVIESMGTPIEEGVPSAYLERAYEINLPHQDTPVKLAVSDTPVYDKYDEYISHFREEGWSVSEQAEVLRGVPEELEHFSSHIEELKLAKLERNGEGINVAVTRYGGETVAAVWGKAEAPREAAAPTEREPRAAEPDIAPEEVTGEDPEDIALYPGSVRVEYRSAIDGETHYFEATYAAEAGVDELLSFYENEIEETRWDIAARESSQEEHAIQIVKDNKQAYLSFRPSRNYGGYSEVDIGIITYGE